MPRYYFHVFDGKEVFDHTGTLLDNEADVRVYMMTIAKIWMETDAHKDAKWSLEARDDKEKLIGLMSFGYLPENGANTLLTPASTVS